jgi:ribokinase
MAPKVVVVGSANTDLVCLVKRLPAPGETVLGGRFVQAAGGKGANQAVAAARLGAEVTFIARLGDDTYGDDALAGYRREKIDTRFVGRDPQAPSGVALILVDEAAENVIAVAPGANESLAPAAIEAAAAAFEEAVVVLLQLEVPVATALAAARRGRAAGAQVVLNPAPMPPGGLDPELLAQIDVLTPNETEAAALVALPSGEAADDEALAAALRGLGLPTVVLTRGRRGALVVTADAHFAVAAPRVAAVDTTAAGDAFNGALAVALAEQRPLPTAVRRACAAGALAATKVGAQPSLPRRAELDRLLEG